MSRKKFGKPVQLTIIATSPKDRADLLVELCSTLALDLSKELEKIGVEPNKSGVIIVNIDHLFKFFYDKKLKGNFNFEEKTLTVISDQYQLIGNDLIDNPDGAKPNEVDEKVSLDLKDGPVGEDGILGSDGKPGNPGISENSNPEDSENKGMTPLDEDLMKKEDDDDDPF